MKKTNRIKVCLVEDEEDLRDVLQMYLGREGYEVHAAPTLAQGVLLANEVDASVWIVDLMLPDGSGFELMKNVKERRPGCKTILISARGDSLDRVLGFEMGCDDYIAKPFLPQELIWRMDKLVPAEAHAGEGRKATSSERAYGVYTIDFARRAVSYRGVVISLTSREFDLLQLLVSNSGVALSRREIAQLAWKSPYVDGERVVDNHIKRLRKKLPQLPIETIYGFGYRCTV